MKFEEMFNEVQAFSDSTYVVSGLITAEGAAKMIADYLGDEVTAEDLRKDWVRFGFAPEYAVGMDGQACWYTGAGEKKGSKPVWVYA